MIYESACAVGDLTTNSEDTGILERIAVMVKSTLQWLGFRLNTVDIYIHNVLDVS